MEDAAVAQAWRATIRRRLLVAGAVFAVWTLAIEARLVVLQVFQHDAHVARATVQRNRTITVPGRRGIIADRNGRTLAMSVGAERAYAIPVAIESPEQTAAALCGALDGCDAAGRDALAERIRRNATRQFLYLLDRQLTPDETRRVLALKQAEEQAIGRAGRKGASKVAQPLKGINLVNESRRVYPNRDLAAHVLGYVGRDNKGLAGIEATYDSRIRGLDGSLFVELDGAGNPFSRVERLPTAGATIALTIDAHIQHIAERELRAAVDEYHAVGGSVVVMDPRSGEILALANAPTFNPNAFLEADAETRRNRGVQEIYEPGSTFKIVTASAAIEERAFTLDEPIDVSAGLIRVASRVITDVHRYDLLSFTDVIVKSSNVGAIKIGTRLGNERLGRYVRRFGFGTRLCPDLPGETAGMLAAPSSWSPSALASISMGYEIGVTPIQMAAAFSSVANGGSLIQPRVVHSLRTGTRHAVVEPLELRRTIDPATVAELIGIMEQVVGVGTGKAALVPGFTVAGKTGTAAKVINGRYSKSDYHASFVGFVPSRQPALTILVVIDTPRGPGYPGTHQYYGGTIAAPVFRRVAEQALRYLGVAPTVNPVPPVLMAGSPLAPPAGVVTQTAGEMSGPAVDIESGAPVLPDLRGLSAREAVRRLTRLGLTAHLAGDGVVVDQDPLPGTPVENRSACVLRLGRIPVLPGGTPQ